MKKIVESWMDGLIEEKLVGFICPEGHIMAAGVVAIARPSGGLLISLARGTLYLWNPSDNTEALKTFIAAHLSLQQQAWLESVDLTAKIDEKACKITSPVLLIDSTNIWGDLKILESEKLSEHLGYHSLVADHSERNLTDGIAAQRLLAASNALSLLAFFPRAAHPPVAQSCC
ncbi:hypothetical protein ABK905_20900 [Acerihabitans sp. KWT182]|uniref:Uncharacterized protein n=1 Tax=Acerihabitans sp. KWT182 TaxID=3157919 RepID=A0AAU7Q7N5_9GAMM